MFSRIKLINITSLALVCMLVSVSCNKDEPEPQEPPTTTPVPPYFQWQIDQGGRVTADSAFARVAGHVVFAFRNSGGSIEINLDNMNVGSHEISSATGNQLQYMENQSTHEATGSFIISESTSTKLSGHFSCNFSNSSLSTITGTFSEIPKR